MGNLLSPVGAGTLSQTVANQEFSRLFERDRFGWVGATAWTSQGDWSQHASHYGRDARFEYAIDATYTSRAGQARDDDAQYGDFQFARRTGMKSMLTGGAFRRGPSILCRAPGEGRGDGIAGESIWRMVVR